MAINRVSDLPEYLPDYNADIITSKDTNFEKSLLELSYFKNNLGGSYLSMSLRVNSLQLYIANHLAENDDFKNHVYFNNGVDINGHVGINEDADINAINATYGLFVNGYSNLLAAKTDNIIEAANLTDIESKFVNIIADEEINLATENDDITLLSGNILLVNSLYTIIASNISTLITAGSEDDVSIAAGTNVVQSYKPLYAPTPTLNEKQTSKLVVNIDYLTNIFASKLSADIVANVIAELNLQSPETSEDAATSIYGLTSKLFELRTFDCKLLENTEDSTTLPQRLWLLGSTINNADINTPVLYSILSAAMQSLQEVIEYDGTQISCYKDNYNHYVVDLSLLRQDIKEQLLLHGTCWFYQVDTTNKTITLPTNNMYFRAGSIDITDSPVYLKPAGGGSVTNALVARDSSQLIGPCLHRSPTTFGTTAPELYNLPYVIANNTSNSSYIYDNTTPGLIAPPSILTYTYMVCY